MIKIMDPGRAMLMQLRVTAAEDSFHTHLAIGNSKLVETLTIWRLALHVVVANRIIMNLNKPQEILTAKKNLFATHQFFNGDKKNGKIFFKIFNCVKNLPLIKFLPEIINFEKSNLEIV